MTAPLEAVRSGSSDITKRIPYAFPLELSWTKTYKGSTIIDVHFWKFYIITDETSFKMLKRRFDMPTQFVKRLIVFCLVLVLLPATTMSAAPVIKDAALAKVIRTTLKISSKKEVKTSDLKKLKSIYAEDNKNKISNLQGLENAVNLVELILPGHNIKNITSLSKLKKMEFLVLEGNQIKDLTPLTGLSNLESLLISGNQIKNLTPLKNSHKLTSLLASDNQIADLSPLQKLNLEWIIMDKNKIQDLTPLKNHRTLEYLYVEDNLIQDIAVLETIPHLVEVSLAGNPLNEQAEQVIQNLEKKGVIVSLEKDEEQ
ncbi:MAG TPA: hypothetical protein DEF35_18760 [Paenibacillus sp.]|uniref:leucine-rich repeat domain-containing protein n=2 Tax=Paenibacillus TaxID=44249 RepID=UPI000E8FD781|nr:leucine-rich repeat domain-containing protein [Paenibacillus taichungensis]HBU83659.1 hypothetical protein [Paenibacillus sp.]